MFEYGGVMSTAPDPAFRPDEPAGVLRAMSPGVVDFLFRQLVAGEPAEDRCWQQEGTALTAQAPGPELARRLAETDLDALTPGELFNYVRAAHRLAAWAESLRETAVGRYCAAPSGISGPGASGPGASVSGALGPGGPAVKSTGCGHKPRAGARDIQLGRAPG